MAMLFSLVDNREQTFKRRNLIGDRRTAVIEYNCWSLASSDVSKSDSPGAQK